MTNKLMNQFQVSGYVAKVSTKDFKNSVLAEILLSIRHATKKNDETVYESALLPCQRWIRTDQKDMSQHSFPASVGFAPTRRKSMLT